MTKGYGLTHDSSIQDLSMPDARYSVETYSENTNAMLQGASAQYLGNQPVIHGESSLILDSPLTRKEDKMSIDHATFVDRTPFKSPKFKPFNSVRTDRNFLLKKIRAGFSEAGF